MNKLNNNHLLIGLMWVVAWFAILCSDGRATEVEWKILTKSNYTSQIRVHPRLLLIVTVPWSGESRSLMKDIANEVASDRERFGTLKLRVLYQNVERTLADAIGAGDGITILYYHNTFSYKYSGKLRVQNVLSSVDYVDSLSPDELPLKSLNTPEELGAFLDSTDKAVLLFEFCGWAQRLLSLNKNSSFEGFNEENNETLAATEMTEMNKKKGMEDEILAHGTDIGFSGLPWSMQFTSANESLLEEAENSTCNLNEFNQLKSFLPKFVEVARESILPPERVRFGLVGERSLLTLLNIEEPSSWLVAVHIGGCLDCLKVLRQSDELRSVLQTQATPVSELEDDQLGVELPAKRPTVLLFVDRSSKSMEMRKESQEALSAFKQLARHYGLPDQSHHEATIIHDKTSVKTNQASRNSLHPRLQSFAASKNLLLKDKMSIMMINEGQQLTLENLIPDLQGSSMQEILTYALKRKKELKLSSLAKEAGFQLLSKDFDIEVVESSSRDAEAQHNQGDVEAHEEDGNIDTISNNVQVSDFTSSREHEEIPSSADGGGDIIVTNKAHTLDISSSIEHKERENPADDVNVRNKVQAPDLSFNREAMELQHPSDADYIRSGNKISLDEISISLVEHGYHETTVRTTDNDAHWKNKEKMDSGVNENENQKDYKFSFLFVDSQYRLLETLTGGTKVPSVVIIDPVSQKHYVLAEQSVISYSLLSAFVNDFLSGLIPPYMQSAPTIPSLRESLMPPFVNMDFRETDSIPQITAHSFTDVVVNGKSANLENSDTQDRNVLVLFSSSFCGFCQRMELVVREVYRAVKAYANIKINNSRMEKLKQHTSEYVDDTILKLPLIYLMDCTQNDCSLITKPIIQREVYPLLLLFPAGKKNETITYEGDITVSDIIKFLSAHGSNVLDHVVGKSTPPDHDSVTNGNVKGLHHEVLLKDQLQNTAAKHSQINVHFPVSLHERPQVFTGCILTATEKLQNSHPFDASKILIVKAEPNSGFLGLIVNKHINWESLEDLGEGFEFLKEAPLTFGGPVLRRGMPLVALTQRYVEDRFIEIIPNVYFLDQLATHSLLEEIRAGNQSVHDYWFFLGYSTWGWEQLFLEIAQGAWNLRNGDMEQIEWPWR